MADKRLYPHFVYLLHALDAEQPLYCSCGANTYQLVVTYFCRLIVWLSLSLS